MSKRFMSKIILLAVITTVLFSCSSKETSHSGGQVAAVGDFELYKQLYERSMEIGDKRTAAMALNILLIKDSTNMAYSDTLARIYLKGGLVEPGLIIGKKVIANNPENYGLFELMAAGKSYTGDFEASIADYKKLYEVNKKKINLYRIAAVELNRQNISNATSALNKIIKDLECTEVVDAQTASGGIQKVNIRAAAYFLKAQIAGNKQDFQTTLSYLQKAVKIDNTYEEAQVGIQQLMALANQNGAARQAPRGNKSSSNMKAQEEKKFQEWKRQNGK